MTPSQERRLKELCYQLKLPTVARRAAIEAAQTPDALACLLALLESELQNRMDRRAAKRLKEAQFPILKTLEGFDFKRAQHLPETLLRELAEGEFLDRAEPVVFIGDTGTGKTHLATALGVAATQRGRRVRFLTAAQLVTELLEASNARLLSRTVSKFSRYELLIVDELGYLPLSRSDADLLFRVLGERYERRSTILTTNLPFGEWTSVFPDPRLCRAVVDRMTHRAHLIDTGEDSDRLRDSLQRRKKDPKRRKKKEEPDNEG